MKRFEELERLTAQAITGFQKAGFTSGQGIYAIGSKNISCLSGLLPITVGRRCRAAFIRAAQQRGPTIITFCQQTG